MISLTTLTTVNDFACDRTCPAHRTHWCRFNALFRKLGTARVHSHTVKIQVEYRDPRALEFSVRRLSKWTWIGPGEHDLFSTRATGLAFKPEGWVYPAVLDAEGILHTDTYEGIWGDVKKLDLLKQEYLFGQAEQAATELGWQHERTNAGLVVYHPQGGTLTLNHDGVCETTGFVGAGCHSAREALHLIADGPVQNKPEFSQVAAQVQTSN